MLKALSSKGMSNSERHVTFDKNKYKHMKNIFKILVCFLIISSCSEDDDNLLEDIAVRGGFVQFEDTPILSVNILEVDTAIISEGLIDQNFNATNYSLTLSY